MPGGPKRLVRARRGDADGDRREGRWRAVLHVHRPRRGRPFREDGPQRHRVRGHPADRGELRLPPPGPRPRRRASSPRSSATWNEGELQSYLIEITASVLAKRDGADQSALVDAIEDEAEQKGTGRWTSQSALDLGVPLTGITEAVFARILSSQKSARVKAASVLAGPGPTSRPASKDDALVDDVRDALYAAKIVAYAQGFEHLAAGSREYAWNLDLGCAGDDLARRLHHPRAIPQSHSRRVRRAAGPSPT